MSDFESLSKSLVVLSNGDFATISGVYIKIWDTNLTIVKKTLKNDLNNNYMPTFSSLLPLPNDKLLAGDSNGRIKIWDPRNNSVESITLLERYDVIRLVLLPNGNVAIAEGLYFKILNLTDRNILKSLTFENKTIIHLKFVTNNLLVIGSFFSLKIWNIDEEKIVHVLPEKRVVSMGVLNDGTLVSGSYELIKLWNVTNGALIGQIYQSKMFNVNALISLGDEYLAAACGDRTIKIWNLRDKTLRMVLTGHTDEVTCLTVFPSNGNLISMSYDRTTRIWKNPLNYLLNS